jgi:formyl-CoA transferase
MEVVLLQQDTSHWVAKMDAAGVPGGPINSFDQTFRDPHILARDMVLEVQHPTAGSVKTLGMAAKLSHTPGQVRLPSPTLGQHTEEILNGLLMLTDKEMADLRLREAI